MEFNNANGSMSNCPWMIVNTNHTCGAGFAKLDTGISPSYVSIVSCTFSVLGSVLIILTFFILKDLQNVSQKIVTLLAIADLISAVGYIIGSANYLHHRNMTATDSDSCSAFSKLCKGQAAVTTYSSLVSFLWTVILAFHFLMIIVFKRVKVASNMMLVYNVIAWGGPLSIVIPLLGLDRLGYARFAASNWCFVKDDGKQVDLAKDWQTTLIILVAGKFWEILSYVIVTIIYIAITLFISKTRRQVRNTVMEPRVVNVETRLLLIPIIFILLRMWGTLQFIFSISTSDKINAHNNLHCVPNTIYVVYVVLGILQAIGDGGQGWGNAIVYIFLSPVIRERLIGEWFGRCIETREDDLDHIGAGDEQSNVQYKQGSNGVKRVEWNKKSHENEDNMSESGPLLRSNRGSRPSGYNVQKYDTSMSATESEGFGTGTDISTAT